MLNVGVVNCHVGNCEPELPSQDQPMRKLSNRLVSVSLMPGIWRSREIATSKASSVGIWISAARSHCPFVVYRRLHAANLQRSGLHLINLRTVSIVSASLAGLSHLIRLTLGNRKAMPDL